MLELKHYRTKVEGLSDLLNWSHPAAPGVVVTKSGGMLAGFFYRGPDVATVTNGIRNHTTEMANAVLSRLGSGWATWFDTVRLPASSYSAYEASHFPDPITRLVDEERREHFEKVGNHYVSEHVMVFMYTPPSSRESKLTESMYDDDSVSKNGPFDASLRMVEQFNVALSDLADHLSGVITLRRMGEMSYTNAFGEEVTEDELVNYLSFALHMEPDPVRLPPYPLYMDHWMPRDELFPGVVPKLGEKFIAAITIDGFPDVARPQILEILNQLPMTYRWSTRFIYQDHHEAVADINRYKRLWKQKVKGWAAQAFRIENAKVNEDALLMEAQAGVALTDANSGKVTYGYYTSVVVLMSESREELEERSKDAVKAIRGVLGFSARRETVNTLEAWLGTVPGHPEPNIRRPLMHTLNLVDLMPLSSVWAGSPTCPCPPPKFPPDSPPWMYCASNGATPFRLNMHVDDLGHHVVFGPTGAGKSTLLALLALQFRRYKDATIFALDNGRSLFAICKAMGGTFYDVAAGGVGFAPFEFLESPQDRLKVLEWVGLCFNLRMSRKMTHDEEQLVGEALLKMATTAIEHRTLTNFVATVQDTNVQDAMRHYMIGGPMGHVFDDDVVPKERKKVQVFELGEILRMGEVNAIPVIVHIFNLADRAVDGNPGYMPIDEAWMPLGHPFVKPYLIDFLKKKRKANWSIGLFTQSLSDLVRSGLIDVVQESTATKIYLPNPEADNRGSNGVTGPYDLYRMFGLNDTEIMLLKTATKKRHYYAKSPDGARMFDTVMGPIALAFAGVSDPTEVERVRQFANDYGDQWAYRWLDYKGIPYEHLIRKH